MACENVNIVTVSRVYADVLNDKPESFFDCETYVPDGNDEMQNYELTKEIGEGKFGNVYIAKNKQSETCIVKILKPSKHVKLPKEIKILEYLKNGTNIIRMLSAILWPRTDSYALIFEWIPNYRNFGDVVLNLNESDARYYIYQILEALDFCHSHGIIHRDVKPHNIIIDSTTRRLCLIDFGLADYYQPGKFFSWVGTVTYMAPEILLAYPHYNYSVDLWAVGCILAAMMFKKAPIFGKSNAKTQLYRIAKILGSEAFELYIMKYRIPIDQNNMLRIRNLKKISWSRLANYKHVTVDDAVCNLLDRLFCYDHVKRITAREAMEHYYFSPLKHQT